MLYARCQLRTFTFYLSMTGNPVLSVGDIVKETGLSRQRIWQLAVAGGIPAKRANPNGKQHRFHDSAEFAAWRKKKAARRSAKPGVQVPRAHRIARRRREKIDRLMEIFKNKTEVNPREKELALAYHFVLTRLWSRKILPSFTPLPLLEGIQAIHESKSQWLRVGRQTFFQTNPMDWEKMLCWIREMIEKLPTRSAP
jgi:hypothetical protein